MDFKPRLLDSEPVADLLDHRRRGGGKALEAARGAEQGAVVDSVLAAGLRGRGGAGFPTGIKWRTVSENRSDVVPSTVVVNAAEGEPGTFKDRVLLRNNPYRVLEGALIAAAAVGADAVVIATKASFKTELERVRTALREIGDAGWAEGLDLTVVEGPSHYLYGEETALLEVISGRNPFPRIAPPYRHGIDEASPHTRSAASETMAAPGAETAVPPVLVNNVETLANVPGIVEHGPDWYRELGTERSPGTVLCTVSGRTKRHGVAEFPLGTPLGEVIESIGWLPSPGRRFTAALSGVANPLVPAELFDTPVSYEGMGDVGSGLGAAGFIVFDDSTDLAAVAAGVARFLSVESCGQCTPCKGDGIALADLLERLTRSEGDSDDIERVRDRVATVADEARCYLAHQTQSVVDSILRLFPDSLRAHVTHTAEPCTPELIAPIVDIQAQKAILDERHLSKQPDWTYGDTFSGQYPADRVRASAREMI